METFNEKKWNEYRAAHPEMRYWQALRNFCEVNFIWVQEKGGFDENKTNLLLDTFYIEDERNQS